MGPKAGLDVVEKRNKLDPSGFQIRAVQFVARRYTDRAIPDLSVGYFMI
jgi:hypothetical protein